MKVKILAALSCAVVGLSFGGNAVAGSSSCESRNSNTPGKLLECVNVAGVREHQAQFQSFADAINGNRASGLGPGSAYELSANYIAGVMEAAGYDVNIQPFDFPFFEEHSIAEFEQISPVMESYPYFDVAGFATMSYSGSGDAGNVVMAGAHLDSVAEGPGVQDNGSGSAAILEVALQMQKVKPRNKVSFAIRNEHRDYQWEKRQG